MSKYRTIEIDIDVHRFIETHRRSFEETPNDVLRRKLPIVGETEPPTTPKPPTNGTPALPAGRPWTGKGVTLPHGTKARMDYNGKQHEAQIVDGAWMIEGGDVSGSPSAAAGAVAKTKAGKSPSLDGWVYWRVLRPGEDKWITLHELRFGQKR